MADDTTTGELFKRVMAKRRERFGRGLAPLTELPDGIEPSSAKHRALIRWGAVGVYTGRKGKRNAS